MEDSLIKKSDAVSEVRMMAESFAELYFTFARELRDLLGEEQALTTVQKALYKRAIERADKMIQRAEKERVARVPENIKLLSDVPYLGWVKELGCDHCPYGAAWRRRIEENPWFQKFAALYCDVTDTTLAEAFTGDCSHKLTKNVVLGDSSCERVYFEDADVARGKRTYEL